MIAEAVYCPAALGGPDVYYAWDRKSAWEPKVACQKAARQVVCRRRACPFQECAPRASMPLKRFGGKGMEGYVIPMLERRTSDRLRLVVHVEQRGSAMLRSHVGVPTHMFLSTGSQRVGWARRWWSMVEYGGACFRLRCNRRSPQYSSGWRLAAAVATTGRRRPAARPAENRCFKKAQLSVRQHRRESTNMTVGALLVRALIASRIFCGLQHKLRRIFPSIFRNSEALKKKKYGITAEQVVWPPVQRNDGS